MSVVALGSTKASPGVTTLCQALAHTWPQSRHVLVVEADPSGGDLAARLELPVEPGLVSLAAAGRRGLSAGAVLEHAQAMDEHASLLVGPSAARLARGALELLGDQLPSALADQNGWNVLVDVGRVDSGSPAMAFARAAELLVLVARPTVDEISHLAPRVEEFRSDGVAVALVLIGEPGPNARQFYPADEVEAAVGIRPLATVAFDGRTAAVLSGYRRGDRVLARSELLRSARIAADALAHLTSIVEPVIDVPVSTTTINPPTLLSTLANAEGGGAQ